MVSATAAAPAIAADYVMSTSGTAWLTMAVQGAWYACQLPIGGVDLIASWRF
ncbi:MAG: hypothetical protein H0U94_04900 [Acidobacteria bacterium]|nr:hypothetical protein [Acidobacteriota bacterium]